VVKDRRAADRLDVATIPHPDSGDHRLHHSLALRRRSIPQGALDIPDELRELGGVRDARLTLRYLLGQFRAPGLKRCELRRELLDASGADVLRGPPLFEGLEVAVQRPLGPADLGLCRDELDRVMAGRRVPSPAGAYPPPSGAGLTEAPGAANGRAKSGLLRTPDARQPLPARPRLPGEAVLDGLEPAVERRTQRCAIRRRDRTSALVIPR
jgi:hypothetical protein